MDIDQCQGHPPWIIRQLPSDLWILSTKVAYVQAYKMWLKRMTKDFVPQNMQTWIFPHWWMIHFNTMYFLPWVSGLDKNSGIFGRISPKSCNLWFHSNIFRMISLFIHDITSWWRKLTGDSGFLLKTCK